MSDHGDDYSEGYEPSHIIDYDIVHIGANDNADDYDVYDRSRSLWERAVLEEELSQPIQEELSQPIPDSPFVSCTRLRESPWVKRLHNYRLSRCVEYELRPDWGLYDLATAASSSASMAVVGHHLLGLAKGDKGSSQMHLIWLTPCIFLARGPGAERSIPIAMVDSRLSFASTRKQTLAEQLRLLMLMLPARATPSAVEHAQLAKMLTCPDMLPPPTCWSPSLPADLGNT